MNTITDLIANPTPEGLNQHLDGRYELINGAIVERPFPGARASQVGTALVSRFFRHVQAEGLGLAFGPGCGYQCFDHEPRRVRFLDGSFVRGGRLPGDRAPRGHIRIAPDLALEILTPGDSPARVEDRLSDFLDAGTRLAWVLDPLTRRVTTYRLGPDGSRRSADDLLDGEDVVPGFTCKIADLFPPAD